MVWHTRRLVSTPDTEQVFDQDHVDRHNFFAILFHGHLEVVWSTEMGHNYVVVTLLRSVRKEGMEERNREGWGCVYI